MSGFRSVNTSKGSDPPGLEEMPTRSPMQNDARVPAPSSQQQSQPPPAQPHITAVDEATTPTRSTFSSTGMSAQRPLPTSPFPDYVSKLPAVSTPERASSQRSGKSRRASRDSGDMDMDDSGGENAGSPGDSGSGNETSTNKKKKTQRFYCTEFPPCNLSFTRSEHLARHIRKHTGERPFQCHCSRRFSRLDNLRQHAQTVHQNEEIPIDSPAAMGTRFQKQIRTDKMRQAPAARSRAATSTGVPSGRGHQKSLSTSIIPSNVANILPGESRRRPPAIVMPNDVREAAYSQESRQGLFDSNVRGPPSESGYHTPTSASFSTGTNSPGWGSAGGPSPTPLHSRSHSMYNSYDDRVRARRLSQPSGSHPFLSSPSRQQWMHERNPPLSPYQQFSPYSGNGSLLPSPTTPTSNWPRRESISSLADDAYRRRTWHPDTRDFAGASRLSQVINTSQLGGSPVPPPLADRDHHDQEQGLRLPGIESFDPPQPPSNTVPRQPSPMMIDSAPDMPRQQGRHMFESREVNDQSDTSLNRGISRLNIDQPPRDSATAWAAEASRAVLAQADHVRADHAPQSVRFEPEPGANDNHQPPRVFSRHQHTVSAPINSYRDMPVRVGRLWEASRAPVHTIQERRERPNMVHPNMDAFTGFPTRNEPPVVVHQQSRLRPLENGYPEARYQAAGQLEARSGEATYQHAPRMEQSSRDDMRGLEALVAVATSERLHERDQSLGLNTANNPRGGLGVYDVGPRN